MNRGDILYWMIVDIVTLEPVARTGTREDARDLCQGDGLIVVVRLER